MSAVADAIDTTRASGGARLVTLLGRFREAGLMIVLAALFLGVSLREPRFASANNIRQILLSIAIIAIVAIAVAAIRSYVTTQTGKLG